MSTHKGYASQRKRAGSGAAFWSAAGLAVVGGLWLAGRNRRHQDQSALPAHHQTRDVRLESRITINRPPEAVYRFWKDFRNLPNIMTFIDTVEPQEGDVTRWVSKVSPAGPTLEWESEIVDDVPGRLLAWRSLEGSDLQNWGTVIFRPSRDGLATELSLALNFSPHNRIATRAAHFMSQLEEAVLNDNLRQLKEELENGEIPFQRRNGKASPVLHRVQHHH